MAQAETRTGCISLVKQALALYDEGGVTGGNNVVSPQVVCFAPCSIHTLIIVLFSRESGLLGGIKLSPDLETIVRYRLLPFGLPATTPLLMFV